jgi:molecular chaperone HtpG
MDALMMVHNIDQPFISQLEYENQDMKFQRIDSDLTENFKESAEDLAGLSEILTGLFKTTLNKEQLEVKVERLKSEKISAMITLSEESRRMQDMMKMYGMGGMNEGMFQVGETLVLNANHPLVKYLGEQKEGENAGLLCEQLYDLAVLAHRPLTPEAMTKFVDRTNEIMLLLTK